MSVGVTNSIRLVVDSSSNVPRELQNKYSMIEVNTLVLFGNDQYELNREIDIESFLEMLATRPEHPTTSQPTPNQFQAAYAKAFAEGASQVLCIVVSAKLSGTYNSAVLAAREFPEGAVEVWDTKGVSFSSGLQAIRAAQLLSHPIDRNQVLSGLEEVRDETTGFFTAKDLEFLARSGRVTSFQKNMANMLSLQPILSISNGLVVPVAKARGRAKAKKELLRRLAADLGKDPCVIGVGHASAEEEAQELLTTIESSMDVKTSYLIRLDPALTALGGPGTLGVVGHRAVD